MFELIDVKFVGQKRNRFLFEVNFYNQGAPAHATVEFTPNNLVKKRVIGSKYTPRSHEDIERIIGIERSYTPITSLSLKKEHKEWLFEQIERSATFQENCKA